MFDYHAHIGKITDDAIVCTSSLEEAPLLSPFKYRSVGLLPGRNGNIEETENYLEKGYFLGEIGLDKRFPDKNGQIIRFRKGLEMAKKYNTLVTIHSVGYLDVTLSLLREIRPDRFIFHSFTSSLEVAREIEKLGGFISLSPKAEGTKHFSALIKNTHFLIETDMETGDEEEKTLSSFYKTLCTLLDKDVVFPSLL